MYILPILRRTIPGRNMENVWMFLERNGTNLISGNADTPIESAKEFMIENDIPLNGEPYVRGNIVFAPVDVNSPKLALFYSWKETPPGTIPVKDAWRNFLWVPGNDIFNINTLLKETNISEAGDTVYSVCTAYYL